jgi:hypothetical protein
MVVKEEDEEEKKEKEKITRTSTSKTRDNKYVPLNWYWKQIIRKCTNQEAREISLKSLFDEAVDVEKVNKHKRKFDYHTDEEKISMLLKFVVASANDRYRNQMDILDWTIEKTADKYSLKKEDFDSIMNLTLDQVLQIIK